RGFAAERALRRRDALASFVRAVHAEQSALRAAAEDGFAADLSRLRADLARGGLRDDLLAPAFAFVREAARRVLGVEHYDVQLAAGRVLAAGMLAEMETGEGKTLAATLPACAAALAGIPVHVVTANDYLVARDADAMRPLYAALGLSVGAVTESES